jgi:hypothetical protein
VFRRSASDQARAGGAAKCVLAAMLAISPAVVPPPTAGAARELPHVSVAGNDLVAGGRPFTVFGFNYTYGPSHPNILYFERPTAHRLRRIRRDFRKAAQAGANTMRIYLELPTFMVSPTRPRNAAFDALRRLIQEAERAGLYLDITGNIVWHAGRASTWYDALSEPERWAVQARFWRRVAHVGAPSPSVLVYELTSEPVTCEAPEWYAGFYGDHWFAQCIVRHDVPGDGHRRARRWTIDLTRAIRREDRRHMISIGLVPMEGDPFAHENVYDVLDVLIAHEYPVPGRAGASVDVLRRFARHDRPVILGETFSVDPETFERFLAGAAPVLDGSMSFFDGRLPEDVQETTLGDVFYRVNLTTYLGMRVPPAPAGEE